MPAVRAGVYCDAVYRRDGGAIHTDESFILFVAGLAEYLDQLVLFGRVDRSAPPAPHVLDDGVPLVELPGYDSLANPLAAMRSMPGSLAQFWRCLDGLDCVWLFGPHPLAVLFAVLGIARRKRVVLGVRQDFPAHMRSRHPHRRAVQLAGLALEGVWRALARICPTIVVGSHLARRYRRARSLLSVVVSVVDEDELATVDEALARPYDTELRLLSVGRLDPEKNPLMLADVIARLRQHDPRWRLVVCGDGTMAPDLRASLRAHAVDGNAEMLGLVSLAELHKHYRNSHVMLHVSWTDAVPQVLYEAFAAGLPVVATDVGGVAEAVGDAALLVPPGDPAAVVNLVRQLAGDGDLRARLIDRGLDVARRHTAGMERQRIAAFLGGSG
jgi:glycosyltransferase involved in cell wall biosynthesis